MLRCKINSLVFIAVFVLASAIPTHFASACIGWGEGWCTTTFQITTEAIMKTLNDTIVITLQQAGAEMITTTVSGMISGGSAQASLFVTNWNDQLFMNPKKKTDVFMNDFFTLSAKGRISTGNYQSCGSSSGLGGADLGQENYWQYLTDKAKFRLNLAVEIPEITLPGNICNPFDLFGKGSWGAFNSFASNPANNPTGYSLMAQNAASRKFEGESATAGREASEGGMLPQKNGDYVTTPAGTIASMQNNALNVGNNILASAQSIPQAAASIVTRIASQSIRQGIGNAQKNAQREINKKTQFQTQQAQQQLGPGSNSPGSQFRR